MSTTVEQLANQMSNVLYNISQTRDRVLTDREREMMQLLVKDYDRAKRK